MSNLRDDLIRLCTEIAYLESVVFNYEDRFFEHCGIDPEDVFSIVDIGFSSEHIKLTYVPFEGLTVSTKTAWESFYKFMESLQ